MGAAEISRLAWQLRAARWGGRGGTGSLHPDLAGYAKRPLSYVHDMFGRHLRALDEVVRPQRLAVFEAFFGLAGPPSETRALADRFGLTLDGVRQGNRAVEVMLADGMPRHPGVVPASLQPAAFQPHRPNAIRAIAAAMTEAVGDRYLVAALEELRAQAQPGWRPPAESLSSLSRMARLRARRQALCLAGFHQQQIGLAGASRTLVPTPRRLGAFEASQDLDALLDQYADCLPTDFNSAVFDLTRKSGPSPELVTAISATAKEALVVAEHDVEPLLSAIALQFARLKAQPTGSRASALAAVQAVRAAQAREMEDLSALHYADSVLRLVGPAHPLGELALREAVLTLRAHQYFSVASAYLQKSEALARAQPRSFARDVAIGEYYSHKAGLTLSAGRASASGRRAPVPTDLADLLYGIMKAADHIKQRDPDGGMIGLVATLRRRAVELAATWPEAPESRRIRPMVFDWADEFRNATVRLGQLQWCRSAMVVALQTRDQEKFLRWDKRAAELSDGASEHFTVLQEISFLRERARRLGLSVAQREPAPLIVASAADLARLRRYTARPAHSGSGLLLVT